MFLLLDFPPISTPVFMFKDGDCSTIQRKKYQTQSRATSTPRRRPVVVFFALPRKRICLRRHGNHLKSLIYQRKERPKCFWKSCKPSKRLRGFESLALRQKPMKHKMFRRLSFFAQTTFSRRRKPPEMTSRRRNNFEGIAMTVKQI